MACIVPTSAAAAVSADSGRAALVKKLNSLRESRGIKKLRSNSKLDQVAQRWAQKMSAKDKLEHNPSLRTQIPAGWRSFGENVGWAIGFKSNPAQIHRGWVQSPPHYQNMVNASFTDVGIGYYEVDGIGAYAVQVFGTYPTRTAAVPSLKKISRKTARARIKVKIRITGKNLTKVTRVTVGKKRARIVKRKGTLLVVTVTVAKPTKAYVRLHWSGGATPKSARSAIRFR
ncbi:CAP domain-containing protein [Rarobacter incanus]|uniref:CAP domain-containing protein n=1 Tax=Rarobacter incanus TaxID=153494 RepID=UPI001476AD16